MKQPFEIVELTDATADNLVDEAKGTHILAIDTETWGCRELLPGERLAGLQWALGDKPFMATFAAADNRAYYTYDDILARKVLDYVDITSLTDDYINLLFHNAKFDLHMLRCWNGWVPGGNYGSLAGRLQDTMLAFSTLFSSERAALKILAGKFIAPDYMDVRGPEMAVKAELARINLDRRERVAKRWVITNAATYRDVAPKIMVPYACQDVILTQIVHRQLTELFKSRSPRLLERYRTELALVPLLVQMEMQGLPVDTERLDALLLDARAHLKEAIAAFAEIAPGVDVSKDRQVADFFYNTLGEECKHYTPTNLPQVNEIALLDMENQRAAQAVLLIRAWFKAVSKYEEIRRYVVDGWVHPNLRADGAKTGRFSASNPQLHNAMRFEADKPWTHSRTVVRPKPGFELLLADWSAVEVRIHAECAGDTALIEALNAGLDPHRHTASKMFGVSPENITKLQRDAGKTMRFAVQYGGGRNKVYEQLRFGGASSPVSTENAVLALEALGVELNPQQRARPHRLLATCLLDLFHETNPSIRKLSSSTSARVQQRAKDEGRGYIINKFGREIDIPVLRAYSAVAALVQGSAADMLKIGLLRDYEVCQKFCDDTGLKMWDDVRLLFTIHDEFIHYVRQGFSRALAARLKPVLTDWRKQFKRVNFEMEFAIVTPESDWAHKTELLVA